MMDLSHIQLPGKMTVSGAFGLMPKSDMDALSGKDHTDAAARLMGVSSDEEEDDGGSE